MTTIYSPPTSLQRLDADGAFDEAQLSEPDAIEAVLAALPVVAGAFDQVTPVSVQALRHRRWELALVCRRLPLDQRPDLRLSPRRVR